MAACITDERSNISRFLPNMMSALLSLNRNPVDEPLRSEVYRRVRPQLLKHKSSPAGLSHRADFSYQNQKLIGDELSPRLRSSQTSTPNEQHLRCSFVDFIDDLLR